MSIGTSYRRYRKIGIKLTEKIMASCLDQTTIKASAKLLGVLRGSELILNSEEEGVAFMDFALNDYQIDGKNAIQRYQETLNELNPKTLNSEEQDLLSAWVSSYSSLFKITHVSPLEHILTLTDLLHENNSIELLDFSLSESTLPGLLIFARIIPFKEFNMTSGNLFAFQAVKEPLLLKKYKYQSKKVKSNIEPIQKFVTFFHLNRTDGIGVGYE